jgi:hypothetical protein
MAFRCIVATCHPPTTCARLSAALSSVCWAPHQNDARLGPAQCLRRMSLPLAHGECINDTHASFCWYKIDCFLSIILASPMTMPTSGSHLLCGPEMMSFGITNATKSIFTPSLSPEARKYQTWPGQPARTLRCASPQPRIHVFARVTLVLFSCSCLSISMVL